MEGELWKALVKLAVFLPLVLLLAYWSIRIGAYRGQLWQNNRDLRMVERLSIGPKAGLCIVQVGNEYYLIGVSEERVELLKELPNYTETGVPDSDRFNLKKLRGPWSKRVEP